MEVILKEAVEGLGNIGDIVKVKPGYARNFLVPKGLATEANPRNVRELEHQKRMLQRKLEKLSKDAQALKSRIEALTCSFSLLAGDEGKLFGSVTSMDLEKKLTDAGIDIERKKIQLPEPIKHVGEFEVPVRLNAGVVAKIKVNVAAAAE
ncbi:50S ribosomal protein L9 [Geoalkalibacter sp.]|uniref:50S ribosomal protein L9 n=1 Tax=Geoalkalibacter sp. TaxID=3041440 RepID=UPI00272DCFD9|nr:50S ribosomal protein L9 [Geoalkalibacter sp.]